MVLLAGVLPGVLRRPIGAVLCGVLSGLGFSTIENWYMTADNLNEATADGSSMAETLATWIGMRGVVDAPWSHWAWTGLAAVGLWYAMSHHHRSRLWRGIIAIAFFLAAVVLHSVSDALPATENLALVATNWLVNLALLIGLLVWARRAETSNRSAS